MCTWKLVGRGRYLHAFVKGRAIGEKAIALCGAAPASAFPVASAPRFCLKCQRSLDSLHKRAMKSSKEDS